MQRQTSFFGSVNIKNVKLTNLKVLGALASAAKYNPIFLYDIWNVKGFPYPIAMIRVNSLMPWFGRVIKVHPK